MIVVRKELTMLNIAQAVRRLCRSHDWHTQQLDDRHLGITIQGEHGHWRGILGWTDNQHLFICQSISALLVPVPRRGVVTEFLARANYGLLAGNFDLDFSDGEVQFRTSTLLHQGRIGLDELQNLVDFNLSMMNDTLPALLAVSFGDKTPAEAINEMEAGKRNSEVEVQHEEPAALAQPHSERLLDLGLPPASN
jgi:hypothetical protein